MRHGARLLPNLTRRGGFANSRRQPHAKSTHSLRRRVAFCFDAGFARGRSVAAPHAGNEHQELRGRCLGRLDVALFEDDPTIGCFTLGIFAGSAGVSLADAGVDRWALKQSNDATWSFLKPFREGGIAFSGSLLTPVALGALGVSVVTRNSRLQEGLLGCATAYTASSAVRTYVIYPVIARTRPDSSRSDIDPNPPKFGDQYDINIPGSTVWGRHSFPGGHLVNVTACAAFLTRRYSMGAAEVVPWAVVGGVGIARMLDRRHWLSDQVSARRSARGRETVRGALVTSSQSNGGSQTIVRVVLLSLRMMAASG